MTTSRLRRQFGDKLATRAALVALALAASAHAQPPPPEGTAPPTKPAQAAPPASTTTDTKAAPPATDAKADETQKRLADLETRLQAAEDSVAQAEARQEDNKIRLYGFSEMGFRKTWITDDRSYFRNIQDDSATFLLGSSNLYIEAQPHPKLRSLSEIRFTLYPNGVPGPDFRPTSNATIFDVTSGSGRNKVTWSGIVIERAVIEWKHSDAFKVMAGYFLTPYGIWNVDHGSPTLISSALPGFFAQEYFPTRLTGLQLLGAVTAGDWELGYRAYLTNGRNRVLYDNQNNKLVGARAYATLRFNGGSFTVGSSGFAGTYLDKEYALKYEQDRPYETFRVGAEKKVEYSEWGAAGDIALDAGPLRVRAEFVANRTDYADGFRAQTSVPGTFYPDRLRMGAYGIIAYRLPWLGLEPYTYLERDHRPDGTSSGTALLSGGLNISVATSARIKLQYFRVVVLDAANDALYRTKVNDFDLIDARFVIAY